MSRVERENILSDEALIAQIEQTGTVSGFFAGALETKRKVGLYTEDQLETAQEQAARAKEVNLQALEGLRRRGLWMHLRGQVANLKAINRGLERGNRAVRKIEIWEIFSDREETLNNY